MKSRPCNIIHTMCSDVVQGSEEYQNVEIQNYRLRRDVAYHIFDQQTSSGRCKRRIDLLVVKAGRKNRKRRKAADVRATYGAVRVMSGRRSMKA